MFRCEVDGVVADGMRVTNISAFDIYRIKYYGYVSFKFVDVR